LRAEYLHQAEGEIREYGRLPLSGIVHIGKKLAEVKGAIGHVGTLTVGGAQGNSLGEPAYLRRSQSPLFTARTQYGDAKAI